MAGKRMIDIHMHVVPWVDDGPCSIDVALEMVRSSCEQGVTDIFCTSHSWGCCEDYTDEFRALKSRVEESGIGVKLHPGCEIDCMPNAVEATIGDISNGQSRTLGASDYVLLEFDRHISIEDLMSTIQKIIVLRNNHIVIAHIERLNCLYKKESAIDGLQDLGCLFQLNAYSLVEERNDKIRLFARKMLEQQRISFLGSDAHRMDHRPPNVASGIQYIYETAPSNYADAVCYKNAEKFLFTGLSKSVVV